MIRSTIRFIGRIIGLVLVVIGLAGIVLAIAMGVFGTRTVNQVTVDLHGSLSATSDTLGTVEDTLEQVQSTLVSVNDLFDTAAAASVNLGGTIDATATSVDRIAAMAETEMPDILYSLRNVVGELATAMETVDQAIHRLYLISAGLVDYREAVPTTEDSVALQASLTDLSGEVRGLAADLSQVSESTAPVRENTLTVSENLATINENLGAFAPIIDQYLDVVHNARDGLERTQTSLPRLAQVANLVIIVLAVWLAALHVSPLVQGWELILKRRAEAGCEPGDPRFAELASQQDEDGLEEGQRERGVEGEEGEV